MILGESSSGQVNHAQGKCGRKPTSQSRATEFRRELIAWKQTPESSRPSLRALACELGTSHQLLTFYLKGLGKWQAKEYWRQAREIRTRAKAENRVLTQWEEQQAHACDRAGVGAMVHSILLDDIERMKEESERGPLCWQQIKSLFDVMTAMTILFAARTRSLRCRQYVRSVRICCDGRNEFRNSP